MWVGSFLLFFSNFLSILLVSALVFYMSGMAGELWPPSTKVAARRFGLAVVGLLVVAVLALLAAGGFGWLDNLNKTMMAVLVLGAIYGAFMGLYGVMRSSNQSFGQMFANMAKVPLLFMLTI